jgi:hypothetical protein
VSVFVLIERKLFEATLAARLFATVRGAVVVVVAHDRGLDMTESGDAVGWIAKVPWAAVQVSETRRDGDPAVDRNAIVRALGL